MDGSHDLGDAIERCLAFDAADVREGKLDPGVDALLRLAGVDEEALELAEQRLAAGLNHVGTLGVTIGDLGVVGQAYTRGVGPIAQAEAEIIGAIVRATPEAERIERLEGLIGDALPLARSTFGLLHRVWLRDALLDELTSIDLDRGATRHAAVAHVDVIASTQLLQDASRSDMERLVDGLFRAGQTAVHDRHVLAVKYVGDGVILAGREPREVADAALDCIGALANECRLAARAGLAYGPVVRRAGDFFGLTVNLSHALTKAAPRGGLLATEPAATQLPGSMVTDRVDVDVTGLDGPVPAAVVVAVSSQPGRSLAPASAGSPRGALG